MFVADEGVAAVMEVWMVWLAGRFTNRPYRLVRGLMGVFN